MTAEAGILPGVADHHVHLGLVETTALRGTPVTEVHDLGWEPEAIAAIAQDLAPDVRVRYAGPFHTAPGGYPSGRAWAPVGAVREVEGTDDARSAVAAARAAGSSAVKIVVHAGMPLLGDAPLAALVAAAHAAGLPAVVHAEGPGQAARAVAAGADALVHAPWSERLDDDVLRSAADRGMAWISTFTIHSGGDLDAALDNARRFVALGGRLRYGTDMGNGDLPVGVNAAEIALLEEVGLHGAELRRAVCGRPDPAGTRVRLCGDPQLPDTAAGLVAWLIAAERIAPTDPEDIR